MKVISVKRGGSPLSPDQLRVTATFLYETGEQEEIWFDLPADCEAALGESGNAWMVLSLPIAMVRGEDITLDMPVDPQLRYNLKGVQRIWRAWYPALKEVQISAPVAETVRGGGETLLFFSGGVDSYFSLVGPTPDAEAGTVESISGLVMVWGLDIPLSRPEEFRQARVANERVARHFGKRVIPMATNLTEIVGYIPGRWWGRLSHGAALAGIGHLLSNRFSEVLIGSTHDLTHLSPWGSHPLVDPLFSARSTRIVHDGAVSTRVEKIARLCEVPAVVRELRVCLVNRDATNCSRCSKCLRTMLAFDLLGKQDAAASFSWSGYSLKAVARQFLRTQNDVDFFLELREAAVRFGRADIAEAIDESLLRSRRWRAVDAALTKVPLLWRIDRPLRRLLIGRQ